MNFQFSYMFNNVTFLNSKYFNGTLLASFNKIIIWPWDLLVVLQALVCNLSTVCDLSFKIYIIFIRISKI